MEVRKIEAIKKRKWEIATCIYLICLFGGYFLFFDVREYSDSFQLLNQFATRDPGYSLFLKFFRDLFGVNHYFTAIGFVQNILAIIAIGSLSQYIGKCFRFCGFFKLVSAFLLSLPHIITPFASSSKLIMTNAILTEGIAYSIFYLWIILMLKMVYEKKPIHDLGALLVALLLSLIRGQLLITIVIWMVVIGIRLLLQKRMIHLIISMIIVLLMVGIRGQLVKSYNDYFWNMPVNIFSGKAMMVANVLYVAKAEDANSIETPYLQELFLKINERMVEDQICYIHAEGTILEQALFHDQVHDTINFDYFEPAARMYLKEAEGIDEMQYLYLMYRVDEVAAQLMKELVPVVIKPYISNYLTAVTLGLIRSIAVEFSWLLPFVIFMYVSAIILSIYLLRKDRQSKEAIFMGMVILLILGNVTATSFMLQCISRYMIYNLPLFYIAYLAILIRIWNLHKEGKGMKIAIRIDDVTEQMNWKNFEKVYNIIKSHGIYPLLGVVPDNQDANLKLEMIKEEFWDKILEFQSEGCTLAMHGCFHRYTSKKGGIFPLNSYSEFAGLSYEEQDRLIKQGKTALEKKGIKTDVFMAPGHTYDANTIKCLTENGYRYITDGFGTFPYKKGEMTFLPICIQMKNAWKKKHGIGTMVLHTNTMSDKQIRALEQQLKEHRDVLISYSELKGVQPHRRLICGSVGEYLIAKLKHFVVTFMTKQKGEAK